MIGTLLIANRGEIARRIMRTCRRMGIRTAAVYSDADAGSTHAAEAHAAARIGPAPAADSYLNIPAILDAARRTGADAVHPGFGFLAESADFARACADAGLLFVGPSPDAIAAMGDKRAARVLAERHGLPVLPGYDSGSPPDGGDPSDDAFAREAARLGYPVMVKAAGGGGGMGMRRADAPGELAEALAAARREATAAFGSGALLLERALDRPRHVEIQLLGDIHGRIIHLGERDCSLQRRRQKVIEETPAPGLPEPLRAAMGAAAVALAQAIGYTSAGTVEFLLDGEQFYFLEMNTRLQVEHPVTELVTGIDLVEWQIRIATGEPLPWTQAQIAPRGHAIEARLYAEDPAAGFRPAAGPVLVWRPPEGEGIRVDDGFRSGDEIGSHYDPLLAKIIAHGDTRDAAIRRLQAALRRTVLLGVATNRSNLLDLLGRPAFAAGDVHTRFLDEHPARPGPDEATADLALVAAAVARYQTDARAAGGYWRNNPTRPAPYLFAIGDREAAVTVQPVPRAPGCFAVAVDDEAAIEIILTRHDAPDMALVIDDTRRDFVLAERDGVWWVQAADDAVRLEARPLLPQPRRSAAAAGSLRAPMPGRVLAVLVAEGQAVEEGQPLVTLEAMKMEHTIRAAAAGVVEAVYFAAGDQVAADALLLRVVEKEKNADDADERGYEKQR